MTATPSAPDTIRATVFIADATPERAAGTAPTTASVAGAITQPIESASAKNHTSSTTVAGRRAPTAACVGEHELDAGQAGGDDAGRSRAARPRGSTSRRP